MLIPDVKDKVAIVTGGSRGIGRGIILMLAEHGCQVAFNYLQSGTQAKSLVKEVEQRGGRCKASLVDIKDHQAVKEWTEQIKREFGRLDILINNAGIIMDKALMLMTQEDWSQVIETNLNGAFHATRACIVAFLKQKRGDIINISSVSGLMGIARQTNYSASKGGINAFTKALAREVANFGIRVNAIAPGFIETEIVSGLTQQQREEILRYIPLGRMGEVKDVVNCVKFLLSEQASYITGQIIQVDGGLYIH